MIPCLPTEPNVVLSIARAAAASPSSVAAHLAGDGDTGPAREPSGSGKSLVAPGRSNSEAGA